MNSLRVFGYPSDSEELEIPLELKEVSFAGDPNTLRKIAEFLLFSAAKMDECGENFGHHHLRDWDRTWPKHAPDVIAARMGT